MEGRAGRVGLRARPDPPAARRRRRHRLHARVTVRGADRRRRVPPSPADRRRRDRRRRDRRVRLRAARPGRHRRRPAGEPGAHPAVEPHPALVVERDVDRSADARRDGAAAADPQARGVRARPVLPARRPHQARRAAQRAPRLARVRSVGRRPTARRPAAPVRARRPPPRGRGDHGPPLRRGAPVRHVDAPCQARDVDAPSERHERPAGAAVHGRGRRLPAADGQPTDEEADHAADEAGAGLRRRRRAVDAEPGRHRLQGAVQRRDVDDRTAADRSRQAAAARRHERRRRHRRRRRRRRHDQRAGQAGVRAAAGRQGPARGVHDPLGDELPAGADDAGPDRAADTGRRTGLGRRRARAGAVVGRAARRPRGSAGGRTGRVARTGRAARHGPRCGGTDRPRRHPGHARGRRRHRRALGRRRRPVAARGRRRRCGDDPRGGRRGPGPAALRRHQGRPRPRRRVRGRAVPARPSRST